MSRLCVTAGTSLGLLWPRMLLMVLSRMVAVVARLAVPGGKTLLCSGFLGCVSLAQSWLSCEED